jgi:hypothetical protein
MKIFIIDHDDSYYASKKLVQCKCNFGPPVEPAGTAEMYTSMVILAVCRLTHRQCMRPIITSYSGRMFFRDWYRGIQSMTPSYPWPDVGPYLPFSRGSTRGIFPARNRVAKVEI